MTTRANGTLTVEQAAEFLNGISYTTVMRGVQRGVLTPDDESESGTPLFKRETLQEAKEKMNQPPYHAANPAWGVRAKPRRHHKEEKPQRKASKRTTRRRTGMPDLRALEQWMKDHPYVESVLIEGASIQITCDDGRQISVSEGE